jgi:hypothetical protein
MSRTHAGRGRGAALANYLGLKLPRSEGHDLAGSCIACGSSDAFRLHAENGVGHCYSCQGGWSPLQIAELVCGDREQAKAVLVEVGIFQADHTQNGKHTALDPLVLIARQKRVTPESFKAFGAIVTSPTEITLPAYSPNGQQCSAFSLSTKSNKGLFAKGKPAGLFFPHDDGKVRLPKPGETWHIVEGPKDAAALHELGLLACGLNTSRLAPKFARLFRRVNVVLIPDRDRAGEEGSTDSANTLRGVAKAVRVAVLPTQFKESGGDDVRDILARADGRAQLEQAITDAHPPDDWDEPLPDGHSDTTIAATQINLSEGDPLDLQVLPSRSKLQRLIVATRGELEHRDNINLDSSVSRSRFVKRIAAKVGMEQDDLDPLLDPVLIQLAAQVHEDGRNALSGSDEPSQATRAVELVSDCELWHDSGNVAYATIPVGCHIEHWRVKSQKFKQYLHNRFFEETGMAMNSESLSSAIGLLGAKATFQGNEIEAHLRVAELKDKVYIDLCNEEWQVVEIDSHGWRILDASPVRFRRTASMLPLPMPEAGGKIDQLRVFLNVDDQAWVLIVSWMVACFFPTGPFPILALFAEHGSGKSTAGRFVRGLVDPNVSPLRAEPKDTQNLAIAANNAWCLAFDNLSFIPPWLSDALCRLSTGGGFSTRELYTDQDEVIFNSVRPVLLTSIEDVASRSDLLDRCVLVSLRPIPDDQRHPESQLIEAYETARPQILGALFDAVVTVLRRRASVKLTSLPRMADFAVTASAAESAFGWPEGTFMKAYQSNRESANEVAMEASPIARTLLALLEEAGEWEGSSGELLEALEQRASDQEKHQRSWPRNAKAVSGHLIRLGPNLRASGWGVEQDRSARKRLYVIGRLTSVTDPSSDASPPEVDFEMQSDAERGDAYEGDDDDANDESAGNSRTYWGPYSPEWS